MTEGSREVVSYEGQVPEDTIQGKITSRGTGQGMMRWETARDSATRVSIAE